MILPVVHREPVVATALIVNQRSRHVTTITRPTGMLGRMDTTIMVVQFRGPSGDIRGFFGHILPIGSAP